MTEPIPAQSDETPNTEEHTAPYHYILTLQRPNGLVSTRAGVANLTPGMGRDEALDFVFAYHFAGEQLGGAVILFFAIERNQI